MGTLARCAGRPWRPILPPLADVVIRALGPPTGRHGERSRRPWWRCPFHPDKNPSLSLVPGGQRHHCFGCRADGDVIDFVRRSNPGMTFSEAVRSLAGESAPPWPAEPRRRGEPMPRVESLSPSDAVAIAAEAAGRLWTPEG